MPKPLAAAGLALVALTTFVQSQTAARSFPLTVDSIMRGPDLVGYPPDNTRWSGDSQRLYFEWRQPKDDVAATWVVNRAGGAPRRLTENERRSAPLPTGQWDAARRRQLGVDNGDIVVIDTTENRRIDITRTTAAESSPRWARNETAVTFVRDNNLFLVPLDGSGGLVQLTDVAQKRPDSKMTDSQRALRREEAHILDWVEQERARRERREAREAERALPRFELAERQSVTDAAVSGDGIYAYLLVTERAQSRTAVVPRFVSESAYTEDIQSRTKVGDAQDRRRLAILNLRNGEAVWAGLEGIVDAQEIPRPKMGDTSDEAPATPPPAPKPSREVRWTSLLLSGDGNQAVASIRSDDNTDRWLVRVDPASGKTRVLDTIHDSAWVREIGPSGNIAGGLGWLRDNRRVWFLAEHTGWMQLYTVDVIADSPSGTAITQGTFEIDRVELSPDGGHFYLESSEAHPGERHIYRVSVDGGSRERLTTAAGAHQASVSPDREMLGLISSASNRPPEVFLMPNRAGATPTQVTTSTSDEWRGFKWVEPQLIQYKARDGAMVYARLFTPEMVGARRHPSRPAVVFVHGAGYLQNAHRYWSSYYREYMFHHVLASQGYVVLDPDYRASAGYGRDWRTAIYGWMGGHDLDDVVDGAGYLAASQNVDARRVGVYGGSYGGFITLMAMFTSPDTFAAGAALRPVTDWAHYNHSYTSNILDEPQSSEETYRKSSPIFFADGLKGALLICHGMVDTNVHFQDSVRLAQRLIELRKENWELAVYPVEDHGFIEATSWADEYKRILKLFDANLKK
ncbi:MAG TPA: prolyl oligopeptidase family serine peptidase [Vicinamibacterales bacterium]|nr:prolyl oligopeptidase family serine peptidase [Vicinamibacterales bacterium]